MEKQANDKSKVKTIESISNSASKIYMNITEVKEFSKQYLEELLNENENLKNSLAMVLTQDFNKDKSSVRKDLQKAIIKLMITVVLGMINLSVVAISPAIGILTTLAYLGYTVNTYIKMKKNASKIQNTLSEFEEIGSKITGIENNLSNNELFIKRELKKFEAKATKKMKSQEVNKVELANAIIQDYYETGIIPEINEDLKDVIISLLKNDLSSEENDITALFEESRKKVNYEDSKSAKLELNKNGKN